MNFCQCVLGRGGGGRQEGEDEEKEKEKMFTSSGIKTLQEVTITPEMKNT